MMAPQIARVPVAIERLVESASSIRRTTTEIQNLYVNLVQLVYSPTVGDEVKVPMKGHADPTGELVASETKEAQRAALAVVAEHMELTLGDLRSYLAILVEAKNREGSARVSTGRGSMRPWDDDKLRHEENLAVARAAREGRLDDSRWWRKRYGRKREAE